MYRAMWIKDGVVIKESRWTYFRDTAEKIGRDWEHYSYVEDDNGNVWYND